MRNEARPNHCRKCAHSSSILLVKNKPPPASSSSSFSMSANFGSCFGNPCSYRHLVTTHHALVFVLLAIQGKWLGHSCCSCYKDALSQRRNERWYSSTQNLQNLKNCQDLMYEQIVGVNDTIGRCVIPEGAAETILFVPYMVIKLRLVKSMSQWRSQWVGCTKVPTVTVHSGKQYLE